jgi:hypothetical protein
MTMLDKPEKTRELVTELMAALPFEVELTPELIQLLRTQQPAIVVEPQRRNNPPSLLSRSKLSRKSPTLAMKEASCAISVRRKRKTQ